MKNEEVISNSNVAPVDDSILNVATATDDDDEIHSRDEEYLDEEEHHEDSFFRTNSNSNIIKIRTTVFFRNNFSVFVQ